MFIKSGHIKDSSIIFEDYDNFKSNSQVIEEIHLNTDKLFDISNNCKKEAEYQSLF